MPAARARPALARATRAGTVVAVLIAVVGALLIAVAPAPAAIAGTPSSRSFFVPVAAAPGSSARIRLDVTLYTPAVTPAPAVLLAHGFGQTKLALRSEAKRLQRLGYVVLAYTARGFGRSGGRIGLDSLDGEVPDARAVVDVLARTPAVRSVRGDPVVGVVGGSYGGALALMLGATDPRIDTVVAAITWHDLGDALAPVSAGRTPGQTGAPLRDFKSGWASRLFGAGLTGATTPCGRFTPAFCALYRRLVTGTTPSAADLALLARSSPATVLGSMRAPTLLLQGLQDDLFGLDQADANARQLAATGAPVAVRWFDGGHDGSGTVGTLRVTDDWLAAHLKAHDPVPRAFAFALPATARTFRQVLIAPAYPGLLGSEPARRVTLRGPEKTIVNPPGGLPESVTGLPGLPASTALGGVANRLLAAGNPAAEAARFGSAPFTRATVLAGTPTVRIRVAPAPGTAPNGEALVYALLSVRTGDSERDLPGGVAPVRVRVPAGGTTVDVTLHGTAWTFAEGDRVTLTLRTSDSQYAGSSEPAAYRVSVAGPLSLPAVAVVATDASAGTPSTGVLLGIAATLLAAAALVAAGLLRGRRRRASGTGPVPAPGAQRTLEEEPPPLVIRGLTKRFRSGFLAVDDVSFSVLRGQVLGLLGENGAGKTTTLRMVAGLIRPDAGAVESFGARVVPGAPVLTRLGCFIEGAGFLPHLSGRRNLELYWAATGRPRREARFEEALAVADLGGAIGKPVRGYSQGMRQRLAIAQAMLGLPDLLVLDEPTNGLDPPQITALRGVLKRYAAAGRTVIVSSHLLGEVEQTCSHVVVMSHGRVVGAGEVGEIAGDASELVVGVTDVAAAVAALQRLGVEGVGPHGTASGSAGEVRVRPGAHPVDEVVAALVRVGVGVTALQRGRRLEEAFLDLIGATEPSA